MNYTRNAVPEVQIAFYLIGDAIDGAALGSLLQVEPMVSIKKGEQRIQKSTRQTFGFYPESTWGFSSAQAVESDKIETHTEWLRSKISKATCNLCSDAGHKIWIEVTAVNKDPSPSLVLPDRLLELASELNATVGVVMCSDSSEWCENDLILNSFTPHPIRPFSSFNPHYGF